MKRHACFLFGWIVALLAVNETFAVDTAFTYQGELKDGGALANGNYNIDVSLWDALSGGNQIGVTAMFNAESVTSGRFTLELDFGANAFNNADRWLEISVNGTELSPRQPITRSPYAIQTRGIVVGDDNNVTLNGLNAAQGTVTMTSPGGINLIIDADTNNGGGEDQNARLVFRQDGGLVTGHVGYRAGLNKLEVMQEYGDELILGAGGVDGIHIRADGFVGIGRNTHVSTAEEFGVYSGATSSFGGMYVQTAGQNARPFYGYSAGGDIDAYHYYNGDAGQWGLWYEGNDRIRISTGTILPITTVEIVNADFSTPQFRTGSLGVAMFANTTVNGNLDVNGTLTKNAGAFRIDHPLDPDNRYLSHSFVESPDMKNVYDGVVLTDHRGEAIVDLPAYFEALNRDFRYQLTVIDDSDEFVLAKVARKITNNRFAIRTSAPHAEVCWQVTGIRDDVYAREHPIVVETDKPASTRIEGNGQE